MTVAKTILAVFTLIFMFGSIASATSRDPMFIEPPKSISFHLGLRTGVDFQFGKRKDIQADLQKYFLFRMKRILKSIDPNIELRSSAQKSNQSFKRGDVLHYNIRLIVCCEKNGISIAGASSSYYRYLKKQHIKNSVADQFTSRGKSYPVIFRIDFSNENYPKQIFSKLEGRIISDIFAKIELAKNIQIHMKSR
jgi:hypothetical protein